MELKSSAQTWSNLVFAVGDLFGKFARLKGCECVSLLLLFLLRSLDKAQRQMWKNRINKLEEVGNERHPVKRTGEHEGA